MRADRRQHMRLRAAIAGILAMLGGLAAGHLVAA